MDHLTVVDRASDTIQPSRLRHDDASERNKPIADLVDYTSS
jgi:hypothetical protein